MLHIFFQEKQYLKKKNILPNKTKFLIIKTDKVANIDNKSDLDFAIKRFK